MAHETLLHMRDVESIDGEFFEVDGDVACDGIDEYIDGALQHSMNPNKEFTYPDGSIHLHRIDGEGEWLINHLVTRLSLLMNMLREMWQFVEAPLLFCSIFGVGIPKV